VKRTITALVFILTGVCLYAQSLSWDIMFIKKKTEESIAINRIIQMEAGEEFLISIKPNSDCFCYVVCYDTLKQISVFYDKPINGGNEIYIGPFKTDDPPGNEIFYVIMSLERLTNLESLIRALNDNPTSQQHSNNLYREVVNLQNRASTLGEPASTFIPGGGTSRGSNNDYVTRFTNKNLYVRPITIRH